mmetsp:Transcript_26869/g.40816  ORF Transcript_26869/g.40816 Transcript_26869/m.40816 type:complete len:404 (+) Transcript_26869:63-1274(+)|eukprot:CAMPEP_0194234182 /NCGR_PEP_ID=MMETSP0158-20130606/1957_1 /TAXON_ID=33649 /ORGANISM="Thalassionema nitzschioides, Strain L26-B" /LENGTH=403 /DNA_ID=CAMNT_0038967271 /DNA_START=48 /DNA_END=1259 /DNA_ORIENTATION=+
MRFVWILTVALQVAKGQQQNNQYIPAKAEQHVIDIKNHDSSSGCLIWKEESPLRDDLELFKKELSYYNENLKRKDFGQLALGQTTGAFAPDLRTLFNNDYSNREQVCREYADAPQAHHATTTTTGTYSDPKTTEQKLRGLSTTDEAAPQNILDDYFHKSQQLSYLPRQGHMEPLLPPLRHPDMCTPTVCTSKPCGPGTTRGDHVNDMDYLIEDFGHLCRHVLHKTMRTVFIDMGASYFFENTASHTANEAIQAIEKYRRHGIHFDHIYAYEVRDMKTEDVYKAVPAHMRAPLHWINMPVSPVEGHADNPWTMLLNDYRPDDFIVVKLDIDTPSVESPLFQQLLTNPQLQELVDVFYFEHHVQMDEMQTFWGAHSSGLTKGSITESLELFQQLRKNGVAAHYWI